MPVGRRLHREPGRSLFQSADRRAEAHLGPDENSVLRIRFASGLDLQAKAQESDDRLLHAVCGQLQPSPLTGGLAAAVLLLIMSGATNNEEVQDLLDAGARGFLAKPFFEAQLAAAVAAAWPANKS